jgi:tetratricopeptide (TPR) repeat protein
MEDGLNEGIVESTENNWRVLAQAWQLAQEDEKAIPALGRAAGLSDDGELDLRLAQSHQNLANWQDCIDAARDALSKGDLRREDQGNMILGACLFELEEYGQARTAFRTAEEDTRSRTSAQSWIQYVNAEEERERLLQAALSR